MIIRLFVEYSVLCIRLFNVSIFNNFRYEKRYYNDRYGSPTIEDRDNKRTMSFKANDPRALFRSVYGYLR